MQVWPDASKDILLGDITKFLRAKLGPFVAPYLHRNSVSRKCQELFNDLSCVGVNQAIHFCIISACAEGGGVTKAIELSPWTSPRLCLCSESFKFSEWNALSFQSETLSEKHFRRVLEVMRWMGNPDSAQQRRSTRTQLNFFQRSTLLESPIPWATL